MNDVGNNVGTMDGTEHKFPDCAAVFGSSGGIGAALVAGLAARGVDKIYAGSRSGTNWSDDNPTIIPFAFDLEDENSIHCAANMMRNNPPQLVIIASGVLNLDGEGGNHPVPNAALNALIPMLWQRFWLSIRLALRLLPSICCHYFYEMGAVFLPFCPRVLDRSVIIKLGAGIPIVHRNRR